MLDTNTMTPLLQRMEKEGFVSREKGKKDGRQMIVSLTDKGKDLQNKLLDVPSAVGRAVACNNITSESLPALYNMLDNIIANLSK